MEKYLLFTLFTLVSLIISAQDNSKYLKGAVPEVNGKVVFSKSIPVKNSISDEQLYSLMAKWAKDRYTEKGDLKNRVLLSDPDTKSIACGGEEYLEFKRSALVLDRAKMIYQLILEIKSGACDVTMRGIRYDYSDSKKILPAEEMITDEYALNKKGDKLNRYYDKFREHTIDSVYSIFKSIDVYLNGINTTGAATVQSLPAKQQQEEATTYAMEPESAPEIAVANSMSGFKKVTADKIPASILNKDALIVTGTIEKPVAFTASWGGTTTLLDKLMGLTTAQQSGQTIANSQTYTISFYTEMYSDAIKELATAKGDVKEIMKRAGLTPVATPSGAPVLGEAWMIIECKKAGEMPLSGATITDLGEILNVWVK